MGRPRFEEEPPRAIDHEQVAVAARASSGDAAFDVVGLGARLVGDRMAYRPARGAGGPAERGAVGARREAHAENITRAEATQAARTKGWKRMARAPAARCEGLGDEGG